MKAYKLNELFHLNENRTEWINEKLEPNPFIIGNDNQTWMFMIFFEKELVVVGYFGADNLQEQLKGYISSLTLIGDRFKISKRVMNFINLNHNDIYTVLFEKNRKFGPTITEEKLVFYNNRIANHGGEIIELPFSFMIFLVEKDQIKDFKNKFIEFTQPWIQEKKH